MTRSTDATLSHCEPLVRYHEIMNRRSEDWRCSKCKQWHRASTNRCKCGHIQRHRRRRGWIQARARVAEFISLLWDDHRDIT